MLIQYSVENYKSIRDEIIINFSADMNARDSEWIINDNHYNRDIYKAIGLFGPNASGKSNIVESLLFALRFINGTISRKDSSKISVEPFMLDIDSKNKPTSFEFIIYSEGIKYVYGFSVNTERVIDEYLMAYYSAKATTIFNRSDCTHYEFKGNDVKLQNEISQKTNLNRLYLPVASEWGYKKGKPVYDWFVNSFRQYNELKIGELIESVVKNQSEKEVLLNVLKKSDFNISNIFVKRHSIEKSQRDFFSQLMSNFILQSGKDIDEFRIPESTPIIYLTHRSADGLEFSIPIEEDSAGTIELIYNIAELLYLGHGGGLFIEDELGKAYHTKLSHYFLNTFKQKSINRGNAQMLFTSHNTSLLNCVNPDQIYLVDKDVHGSTFVKLLDDYIIREKDNIELGYLKGRYGAIPYIKE